MAHGTRSIASAWYSWSLPWPPAIEASSGCTSPPQWRGGSRLIPPAHPPELSYKTPAQLLTSPCTAAARKVNARCLPCPMCGTAHCHSGPSILLATCVTLQAFKPSLLNQAQPIARAVTCGASSQKMQWAI